MGKVYFVGGGPYDASLLTQKAVEVLHQADCILYDHLLADTILDGLDAKRIYVGKQAGHHPVPQEEINALLVEMAMQYECVVRLKGGDSFVFGRGGEEALALYEKDIKFCFVPGISSCIAVAEMAGIPLTHRGIASGFLVLSAHLQHPHWQVDLKQLENPNITLVFLMGLARVEAIVDKLIAAQRSLETPIAIISQGASPNQQVFVSTLGTISETFIQEAMKSPAMIVVGEVVRLREKLTFFEQQPLFSKTILILKINDEPSPLRPLLEKEGSMVEELQVGEIVYKNVEDISQYWHNKDAIVFTSRHAIHGFFKNLHHQLCDARCLHQLNFYVMGAQCAKVLASYGIHCDAMAKGSRASLQSLLAKKIQQGEQMLYVKAENVESLSMEVNGNIETLDTLSIYENMKIDRNEIKKEYDILCFSCASSVERYSKDICNTICVSIGPSTSYALKHRGAKTIIEAVDASYASMVETLVKEIAHV